MNSSRIEHSALAAGGIGPESTKRTTQDRRNCTLVFRPFGGTGPHGKQQEKGTQLRLQPGNSTAKLRKGEKEDVKGKSPTTGKKRRDGYDISGNDHTEGRPNPLSPCTRALLVCERHTATLL